MINPVFECQVRIPFLQQLLHLCIKESNLPFLLVHDPFGSATNKLHWISFEWRLVLPAILLHIFNVHLLVVFESSCLFAASFNQLPVVILLPNKHSLQCAKLWLEVLQSKIWLESHLSSGFWAILDVVEKQRH